ISQSPNDLQPVLDAIAETAMRLCPSDRAAIRLKSNGFRPSVIVGDMPDRITEEYKDWAPILDRRLLVACYSIAALFTFTMSGMTQQASRSQRRHTKAAVQCWASR